MGYTRGLMVSWWHESDEAALAVLRRCGAQYSGTRHLGNATAAYAEYLVCKCLRGERLRQASGEGDCRPPTGRVVEVKATTSPFAGWNLQYGPGKNDYGLVRFNLADWRVTEAWFVPMHVAKRHISPSCRLPMRGPWQALSQRLPLHRY
jgi:hypothetical protein